MKVLLIEDDQTISLAYTMIIKKHGYELETAYDGREGLQKAATFQPDLILLDMLMPNVDGIGFLTEYVQTDKPKDAKVVLMTNLSSHPDIKTALELGVKEVFLKSDVNLKALVDILEKYKN